MHGEESETDFQASDDEADEEVPATAHRTYGRQPEPEPSSQASVVSMTSSVPDSCEDHVGKGPDPWANGQDPWTTTPPGQDQSFNKPDSRGKGVGKQSQDAPDPWADGQDPWASGHPGGPSAPQGLDRPKGAGKQPQDAPDPWADGQDPWASGHPGGPSAPQGLDRPKGAGKQPQDAPDPWADGQDPWASGHPGGPSAPQGLDRPKGVGKQPQDAPDPWVNGQDPWMSGHQKGQAPGQDPWANGQDPWSGRSLAQDQRNGKGSYEQKGYDPGPKGQGKNPAEVAKGKGGLGKNEDPWAAGNDPWSTPAKAPPPTWFRQEPPAVNGKGKGWTSEPGQEGKGGHTWKGYKGSEPGGKPAAATTVDPLFVADPWAEAAGKGKGLNSSQPRDLGTAKGAPPPQSHSSPNGHVGHQCAHGSFHTFVPEPPRREAPYDASMPKPSPPKPPAFSRPNVAQGGQSQSRRFVDPDRAHPVDFLNYKKRILGLGSSHRLAALEVQPNRRINVPGFLQCEMDEIFLLLYIRQEFALIETLSSKRSNTKVGSLPQLLHAFSREN